MFIRSDNKGADCVFRIAQEVFSCFFLPISSEIVEII